MKIAILGLFMFAAPVFAAGPEIGMTPPFYDSITRIQAVLEADKLDLGEQITSIKAINDLKYQVSGENCSQVVTLKVYPSNGLIGPAVYGVKSVSRATCN